MSYDVVDLFTNVPREKAINILRQRLTDNKDNLDTASLTIDSLIQLTESCIESTYFTWGNKVYEQLQGLPMGSPLSPILTEIYMSNFEETALQSAPVQPICWLRKVDDVFAALHEKDNPETLLEHLNSQDSIKFTMEPEKERKLPFLDVLVKREDGTLRTSVYRKPTHTDQYVHYRSNHPNSVKSGIISTLTRRAINICSTPESLESEREHIRRALTEQNGYPEELVKNVMDRTTKSIMSEERGQVKVSCDSPILITLPFRGAVSYHIKRLLTTLGSAKVVFKKQKTIKNILNANGKMPSTISSGPKGSVYRVACSCDASYIGETGRPLEIRIKEHKKSVENKDQKSAISEHLMGHPDHSMKWDTVENLCTNIPQTTIRKLSEAIQIKRYKPQMNRDQGLFLPIAYDQLIGTN